MNLIKKHILLFTIVSIAFLISCSKTEQNPILAKIDNGSVLYTDYLDHYLRSAQYKPEKFPTQEDLTKIVELKAIEKMAVQEALEEGIDKDSTYLTLVNNNERRLLFQKYVNSKFTSIVITDSLIQKFYSDYSPQYLMKFIMRPIVKTSSDKFIKMQKDTIWAAYKELQNGTDFAKVAERYSQDKTTNKKGGEIGWIIKESMGDADVRAVMDTLSENSYSIPFRGFGGYYILYKGGHRIVDVPPFETVSQKIWKSLYRSRRPYIQKAVDDQFAKSSKKYNYKLYEDKINKALKKAGFKSGVSKYRELDFSKLTDKDKGMQIAGYDGGSILLGELFANSKKAPINKLEFDKRLDSVAKVHMLSLRAKELNIQDEDELPEKIEEMRISLLRAILFKYKVQEKVNKKLAELKAEKDPGKRNEVKKEYQTEYENYLKTKYHFSFVEENFPEAIRLASARKKEQNLERSVKAKNK